MSNAIVITLHKYQYLNLNFKWHFNVKRIQYIHIYSPLITTDLSDLFHEINCYC